MPWSVRLAEKLRDRTFAKWRPAHNDPRGYCTRTGHQWLFRCPVDGFVKMHVPCEGLSCRTCYERVVVRRMEQGFERVGGALARGFVFTFPDTWHDRLTVPALLMIRRAIYEMLAEWNDGEDGGVYGWAGAFHPCGDENPRKWEPHFHFFSSIVGVDPERSELIETRYHLDDGALFRLRRAYADLLARIGAVLGHQGPIPMNMHYRFLPTEGQVRHRIRYDWRPFPEWYVGPELGDLRKVAFYGLMAPTPAANVRHMVDAWRERVRGTRAPGAPARCPWEGCAHDLEFVGLLRKGTRELWKHRDVLQVETLQNAEAHPSIGPPRVEVVPFGPEPMADDIPY